MQGIKTFLFLSINSWARSVNEKSHLLRPQQLLFNEIKKRKPFNLTIRRKNCNEKLIIIICLTFVDSASANSMRTKVISSLPGRNTL